MSYFLDPDSIDPDRTWVLQQLPKRVQEFNPKPLEPVEAWGLYFKQGWDWFKIWCILGVVFLLSSLLFGILWTVLQKDIQGAFGVAGWIAAAVAILMGIFSTKMNSTL